MFLFVYVLAGSLFVSFPVGGVAVSAVDHLFSSLNLLELVLTFLLRRSPSILIWDFEQRTLEIRSKTKKIDHRSKMLIPFSVENERQLAN